MENREIAIQIKDLKKMYKLGQIGGGTLQGDLQSWWARVRGKEDPNSKIGADRRSAGKTFMALNGIDLTVYKGEALGIIGHNGAGKSTLLKLLSRVTAPTEGEIGINGRIASMLEVGTGFNGEMTGRENVYMNGAILGMSRAEIDAKMEQIIDFSEVREFIDTPVKRYSSGMYVKLAFSVAAHLDSEIMIMDEVLAVGDINFQQKCLNKMKTAAQEEGRTVLYVSHNMSTIKQLCDRCIVLGQGKVIFSGDVDDAIGVYTASDKLLISSSYDVSTKKRAAELTKDCHMNIIEVPKSLCEFGDSLRFAINFDSYIDTSNAMIRFVVYRQNGAVVGTSYSELFNQYIGENRIDCSFDTKGLMPGKYYVSIIICRYDNETQLRQDVVDRAFAFEMHETELFYNVKWTNDGWGSVKFNDITIETRRKE